MDRFSEFRQDWNPVCSLDKNPALVFVTLTVFELNGQRYSLAQAQARETECVLKRCLLSGVI